MSFWPFDSRVGFGREQRAADDAVPLWPSDAAGRLRTSRRRGRRRAGSCSCSCSRDHIRPVPSRQPGEGPSYVKWERDSFGLPRNLREHDWRPKAFGRSLLAGKMLRSVRSRRDIRGRVSPARRALPAPPSRPLYDQRRGARNGRTGTFVWAVGLCGSLYGAGRTPARQASRRHDRTVRHTR